MKRHGISLRVLNGFVVGLFLFMSCATTTISLQPDPSCQQQVLYDSGKKMFVSTQRNVVAVRLNTEYLYAGERGEISVCVLNSGKDLFDFGPENIHVRSATDELKVYTYEELVAELEQAWRSQAMAMALVGTLNAVNAQQSAYQYNYGSFNAFGPGCVTYGSYSGYTYDPAAAQLAQSIEVARTKSEIAQLNASASLQMQALSDTILRRQTVPPETWFGGVVRFAMPRMRKGIDSLPIIIDVELDGETYDIHLIAQKVKNTK